MVNGVKTCKDRKQVTKLKQIALPQISSVHHTRPAFSTCPKVVVSVEHLFRVQDPFYLTEMTAFEQKLASLQLLTQVMAREMGSGAWQKGHVFFR